MTSRYSNFYVRIISESIFDKKALLFQKYLVNCTPKTDLDKFYGLVLRFGFTYLDS